VTDQLSVNDLQRPVLFASGFSRSGWGLRSLVDSELAHAFDLPSFRSWESVADSKMVPIHMFRVMLDGVLATFLPDCPERGGRRLKINGFSPTEHEVRVIPRPLDREWTPSLQRCPISDKAVKSDNAEVDFYPWNQQITLLFPCPLTISVSFEEFAMRRWRQALMSSFLRYVAGRHGTDWRARLTDIESDGRLSDINSDEIKEPPGKRRRVHVANVVGGYRN
jgi:hypothetical protein